MKLIVGLGNPGTRYAKTRHNTGRRVVETLARQWGVPWRGSKALRSCLAEIREGPLSFCLALPELFMNETGESVGLLVSHFGIDFKSGLLVVVDDAALPFGKLRLRARGSDGGHRGLRSVEQALKSREYARLRIGIAPLLPTETPLEEYVLSPFAAEERKEVAGVLERAAESCQGWLKGPS